MASPFDLNALVRPNVLALKPYSSARDEFTGRADVFLDANENPFPCGYNRYPDPHQRELKAKVAALKGVSEECVFLGNGSDEAIDLLFRAFCRPGIDKVIIASPTYGMYSVSAAINDVEVLDIPLDQEFQPHVGRILYASKESGAKLLFLCSPNNPTANAMRVDFLEQILPNFDGIVVLDEAYVDFAPGSSLLPRLAEFPNLVVLQTFSKAWGMAAVRLGMAFAQAGIIRILDKIKPPYNLSGPAQQIVSDALDTPSTCATQVDELLSQRALLMAGLLELPNVLHVFPSDANFVLVRFQEAGKLFSWLQGEGIIVRDRTKQVPDALRLTVGTADENRRLLHAIATFHTLQDHA